MTEHTTPAEAAGEALDWLAGRLRWERILRELHDQAEAVEPATGAEPAPGEQAA